MPSYDSRISDWSSAFALPIFNRTQPARSYVETALAIQNMGFLRVLSPRYMAGTPEINDWVHELVQGDEELQACGFGVLREWAAIGYTGDAFHALGFTSPYQTMLAALWRESPFSGGRLAARERPATPGSSTEHRRVGKRWVRTG